MNITALKKLRGLALSRHTVGLSNLSKGFTLIELLIVIAVLGIIAAGVVAAINPLRRINQANDSKVQNDIGQVATALQAYYTTNQSYPSEAQGLGQLVTSQDLKVVPAPPSGYVGYSYKTKGGSGCAGTAASPCTDVGFTGEIKAPKTTGNTRWCWKSWTGVSAEVADDAACAP